MANITLSLLFVSFLVYNIVSVSSANGQHVNKTSPHARKSALGRRYAPAGAVSNLQAKKTLCILVLLLSGDVQVNPGPRTGIANAYPCAICEYPVTWATSGVACGECLMWYHKSCMEMCSAEYATLNRSNVQWICHRCDSMNCDSFTFRSYEVDCTNHFAPLADSDRSTECSNGPPTDRSLDSVSSSTAFSPLKASSPHTNTRQNSSSSDSPQHTSSTSRSSRSVTREQNWQQSLATLNQTLCVEQSPG